MTDSPYLWLARVAVCRAYTEVRALSQHDPAVRETVTQLDDICIGLTQEISDAEFLAEPELPLPRVSRVVIIGERAP